jgi:hypothetical protein
MVTIASAAASYNPVWYAVMGVVALPFSGDGAVYAMRLITCLASALLCAWAASLTTSWSRNRWPLLACIVASTPTLIYSTSVAAPNGIEYAAAMLTWSAALSLAQPSPRARSVLPLLIGSFGVCVAHSTGPMWLCLILLTTILTRPVRHWWELARTHRGATGIAVLGIAAMSAASLLYVYLAKTNAPEAPGRLFDFDGPKVALQNVLWPLQATAAFPLRDQQAPAAVYALWMVPLVALLVMATRHADRRTRGAALLLMSMTIVIPTVLTAATYSMLGPAWQGRYSLPLYVGLVLMAGWSLQGRSEPRTALVRILMFMLATASAVGVAHAARDLVVTRPGVSAAEVVPGGWLAVAVLAAIGTLLPLILFRTPRTAETATPHHPDAVPVPESRVSQVVGS